MRQGEPASSQQPCCEATGLADAKMDLDTIYSLSLWEWDATEEIIKEIIYVTDSVCWLTNVFNFLLFGFDGIHINCYKLHGKQFTVGLYSNIPLLFIYIMHLNAESCTSRLNLVENALSVLLTKHSNHSLIPNTDL